MGVFGMDDAIIIAVFLYPCNPVIIAVKGVERNFIVYPQACQQSDGNAKPQTADIQRTVQLVVPEVAESDFQVIVEHGVIGYQLSVIRLVTPGIVFASEVSPDHNYSVFKDLTGLTLAARMV